MIFDVFQLNLTLKAPGFANAMLTKPNMPENSPSFDNSITRWRGQTTT
jgi:hypothetical protein